MKIPFRPALIIFTLFLHTFFVADAKAQGAISEILKRMRAHQRALLTLRSNVTMEQFNVQLQESDVFQGTYVYLPSAGNRMTLRVDWTKPRVERLAFINGQYIFYTPGLKQAVVGDIDKTKNNKTVTEALSIINMPANEIKANYTILYLGQEAIKGGTRTWHLQVTPKKKSRFMSAVDLWVDKDGMVLQTKVNHPNKDSTTVLFSDLKKNVPVNAADFLLKLPKGTKIIRSSEFDFSAFENDSRKEILNKMIKAKMSKRVRARKKRISLKANKNVRLRNNKIKRRSSR